MFSKKKEAIYFLIILIFFISLISSSFSVLEENIKESYAPDSNLSGYINISLEDEDSVSFFNDSLGNSIKLIDLINQNNFSYTCEGYGCTHKYTASNPEKTKQITLNSGESEVFGFKLNGEIRIDSINFTLQGDSSESCDNQIEVDFFNNNEIKLINNEISEFDCDTSETMGCFEDVQSLEGTEAYDIDLSEKVCQRITLPKAPGIKAGAWINKTNETTKDNLSVSIYSGGDIRGECEIKYNEIDDYDKYGCDIDYLVKKPKEVYVCMDVIGKKETYYTKGLIGGDTTCGFLGDIAEGKEDVGVYGIFAKGKKFDSPDDFKIQNPEINSSGIHLSEMIQKYLIDNYEQTSDGNIDCSNDCIIPFKINSKIDQEIILKDLSLSYSMVGAARQEKNEFYEISNANSILNSDYGLLYFDESNFSLPKEKGNLDYNIKLGGKEILSKELLILNDSKINFLLPTRVPVLYSVEYELDVENPETITNYIWEFDNKTRETENNKITHTYSEEGVKTIKVSVENENNVITSKKFEIHVESFESTINKTLNQGIENLEKIRNQINEFSGFEKKVFESIFDLNALNGNLTSIQRDFLTSENMSKNQKQELLKDLLKMSIPKSISKVKESNKMMFYPQEKDIKSSRLEEINQDDPYDSEKNYKNTILGWHQQNIDSKIIQSSFMIVYENKDERLNIFKADLNKKNMTDSNSYIILDELGGMYLDNENEWSEKDTYFYKNFSGNSESINFATTENFDFDEIPLFITPDLNELNKIIESKNVDEFESETSIWKWVVYSFITIILLIIAFFVYVFLYKWYEHNYEDHLFKNRNDLYNLINYINLLRNNNVNTGEIQKKLRKAGWSYEQVNYVIKKYLGKRTG
ncbi:MAG: PKD domain-containing protein, partial [Nanoarchaeota archaeon]